MAAYHQGQMVTGLPEGWMESLGFQGAERGWGSCVVTQSWGLGSHTEQGLHLCHSQVPQAEEDECL